MIRPSNTTDINAIADLEGYLFDNAMSSAALERELEGEIGFAYVIGNPVVAYALVRVEKGLFDLTRLGVHPDHQGKGYGRALLHAVLAHGLPTMLTVKKDNERAYRMYRRAGFEIAGHVIGRSAWVLRHSGRCASTTPTNRAP